MVSEDRQVRYHPLFDCDVREAAAWYDQRSPGLGGAFTNIVRSTVEKVIGDPGRFALAKIGCRYARVLRFPYIVLFDVVDDELLVLALLHTARSDKKWRERLDDA